MSQDRGWGPARHAAVTWSQAAEAEAEAEEDEDEDE